MSSRSPAGSRLAGLSYCSFARVAAIVFLEALANVHVSRTVYVSRIASSLVGVRLIRA
ncbi:MAG: hypothetical protein HKN13_09410 [Rhodothermales bacterium]|nr:hypothetical protein [Rhodothermales bacterium]